MKVTIKKEWGKKLDSTIMSLKAKCFIAFCISAYNDDISETVHLRYFQYKCKKKATFQLQLQSYKANIWPNCCIRQC